MNIIEITSLDDPRVSPYCALTDAQLRNRLHPDKALIVVDRKSVV